MEVMYAACKTHSENLSSRDHGLMGEKNIHSISKSVKDEYQDKAFFLKNSDDLEDSGLVNNNSLAIDSPLRDCSYNNKSVEVNFTPYRPMIPRCHTFPGNVYPDLINEFPNDFEQGEEGNVKNSREDSVDEEGSTTSESKTKGDTFTTSNNQPRRMHFLENIVYMSNKRNNRARSLPVSALTVNLNDMARLRGIYEKANGKKRSGGSKEHMGKSVLNRLTKKLTLSNNKNESDQECKDNSNRRTMSQKFKRTFAIGGDNFLQQAIVSSDLEMLEKLLTHERYMENINYLEPPGVTVFHQACVYGDLNIVKLLLDKGADVGLVTWSDLSPLRIAVMFGHYEIAEILLHFGANMEEIKNGFQPHDK